MRGVSLERSFQSSYSAIRASVVTVVLSCHRAEHSELIDTLREVHVPSAWTDAGTFLCESPDWFGLDLTAGQSHALYVAAEKDTLRQLLTRWLAPYGIPVLVVRDFGSQSYVDVVRDRVAADLGQGP